VWYRYCRLIIAGKEHLIKNVINYFRQKGEIEDNLNEIYRKLVDLDKSNKIQNIGIIEDKVNFNGDSFDNFIKFSETIDELHTNYFWLKKQEKLKKEQKELQKEEIEFVPGKISVYPCNDVSDTIKYGVGLSWCISKPGNRMYDSYRSSNQSTFYYVQDGTRQSDDPLSRVMVDRQANDVVKLTDINNTTGTIAEFGRDWKKYFEYLEKNGVDISQFVNKPLTQEEIEETKKLGTKNYNLIWFKNLTNDEKSKYIGRGHLLTNKQLEYLLSRDDIGKLLIPQYLNSGLSLPPKQKEILFSNKQYKNTYDKNIEITHQEIKKYFKGNKIEILKYALETNQFELVEEYQEDIGSFKIENFDNDYAEEVEEDWWSINISAEMAEFLYEIGAAEDNLNEICSIPGLSEDFIRKFSYLVNWHNISRNQKLSEDFIREFENHVVWRLISRYQKLSEDFIREFLDKIEETKSWDSISYYQKLSEDFIREFQDKVDWKSISQGQKLSEDFIREFKDKVDWQYISWRQKLSEDFIREFKDKVNWHLISEYQTLSEDFIREFKDKVDWGWICHRQTLSEDFIREFKDKVKWGWISRSYRIPKEIKQNLKAQGFPIEILNHFEYL